MKPVVSSIVALAIAMAPALALAAETSTHKPVAAKIVKHHKKAEKAGAKAEKPALFAHVKHVEHVKKDGDKKSAIQKVNHEIGHKGEPKVDHGVMVIPASMTTKPKAPQAKPAELPKLPAPAANKPAHGKEKGTRKPAEKKGGSDDKSDGGQAERDEDLAELVARIRGQGGDEPRSSASERGSKVSHARAEKPRACMKDAVEIARGPEIETFQLTGCDGSLAPMAVERLSVLVRPGTAARPTTPLAELAKKKGAELAKGIRRVAPGLVTRLQSIADHFHGKGAPLKLSVVSGVRPASVGSLHQTGRAMDFRLDGATNEEVVAFCKTLVDTGCGYYPNSSFVHVDVRDAGAGYVSWIDASGPGEAPRYVSVWPPAAEPSKADAAEEETPLANASAKLSVEAPPEPVDEHPSEVTQ